MQAFDKDIVVDSSPKDVALLQAFVAVVAAGSFSAAARRTGIDKSQLSRRVRALEGELGVRLIQRTTRRQHVTDAGQSLYEAVRGPLDLIATALGAARQPDELAGRLRVATIPAMARQIIVPVSRSMLGDHPNVEIDLRAEESFVDLVGEGIDVAFRVGNLADSSLVCRRIGTWRYVLCASPAWVAAHRKVTTPAAIADHWVLYSDVPNADQWRMRRGEDAVELRVRPVLRVDDSSTLTECVLAGMGVGALSPLTASEHMARGELVRVAPDWIVDHTHGIFAVYPHRAFVPRRVEVYIERVTRRVRELEPHWSTLSG